MMGHDDTLDRILAIGLLLVVLETVTGAFWLASVDRPIPDALIALGSAALGALGTMFLQRHSNRVEVTNTPSNPVQVEETAGT